MALMVKFMEQLVVLNQGKEILDLKSNQRLEAEKRIKLLMKQGMFEEVLNVFHNNDISLFEDYNGVGIHYYIRGNCGNNLYDNYLKIIEDFEKEYNATVYLTTLSYTSFGKILNIFYVSSHSEEWEYDVEDLKEKSPLVYAYNLSDNDCSEFGNITYKISIGGGVVRTA